MKVYIRAMHDCGANGIEGCPVCTVEELSREVTRLKSSLRNQATRNKELKKLGRWKRQQRLVAREIKYTEG